MDKYKIVEVEWFDAQQSNQPMTIEDIEKYAPILTKSIGYLLFEKEKFITLGSGLLFDGVGQSIQYHIIIPKGMIKHMREIKNEKRTKRTKRIGT